MINNINSFNRVNLWFGEDTFCQINQLFILTMLEERNYLGEVNLIVLDSKTHLKIIDQKRIILKRYKQIYKALIHEKEIHTENLYLDHAIQLYYDYKNPKGVLQCYAKENKLLPTHAKLNTLMRIGEPYRLTDLQVKKLSSKET